MLQLHDTVPFIVPPPHGPLLKSLGGGFAVALPSLAIRMTAAANSRTLRTERPPMAASGREALHWARRSAAVPASSTSLPLSRNPEMDSWGVALPI